MNSLGQQILKSTSPIVLSRLHDGLFQEQDRFFNVDSSLAQSTGENLSFRYLIWFCSLRKMQFEQWAVSFRLDIDSQSCLPYPKQTLTHDSLQTCRWKRFFFFLVCRGSDWKSRPLACPGLSSWGLPPRVGVIFINAAEAFGSQQTGSGAIWSFCELQPQAGVCYSLHTPTHIHIQAHSSTQI